MKAYNLNPSKVATALNLVGLVAIITGGGWDLVYHLAPFWGVRWPVLIDVLGEFGHTVIFFGIFIVLFGLVLKRKR